MTTIVVIWLLVVVVLRMRIEDTIPFLVMKKIGSSPNTCVNDIWYRTAVHPSPDYFLTWLNHRKLGVRARKKYFALVKMKKGNRVQTRLFHLVALHYCSSAHCSALLCSLRQCSAVHSPSVDVFSPEPPFWGGNEISTPHRTLPASPSHFIPLIAQCTLYSAKCRH